MFEEPEWNPEDLDAEDTPPDLEDPDIVYAEDLVFGTSDFVFDDGSGEIGYYVAEEDWTGNVPAPDEQETVDPIDADEGDVLPIDPDEPEEDIFPDDDPEME